MYHVMVKVDTKDVNLYPIADVQVGARGVDEDSFAEYVEEIAADPIGRAFGGGDYTDGISPSNRKLVAVAKAEGKMYDTTANILKAGHDIDRERFQSLVSPIRGRTDFMLKGHHLLEYAVRQDDGTHILRTSDHDIADYLGARFLGEPGQDIGTALVTYSMPPFKRGGPRPEVRMFAYHGQGAGNSFASPLNSLEKHMRAQKVQILFTAHHHKVVAGRAVQLQEDVNAATQLMATDAVLVSGGSWMRSYLLDETTYAEDGLMVPLAIGAPTIMVRRDEKRQAYRVRVLV